MASQYDLPYTGPQVETLLAKISELESEMPSKTSDLTNDSGFITSSDVPTKTSDLNNDSGFITNAPVAAEAARAQAAEALLATISSLQAEISRATGVEGTLQDLIDGIAAKIPSAATDQNQLADKAFVNSSIATASATFRGTYISLVALQAVAADENDYGYVISTDAVGNTIYNRYKYANSTWTFEYAIANPIFDSSQWAAINSAVTAELVAKLSALPDNATLTAALAAKQDVIDDLSSIRSKANSAYQKPAGGIPASDLASAVQTSLNLADTAVHAVDIEPSTSPVSSNYYTKSETATYVTGRIADNLTTNDATKMLSAKQGKTLQDSKINTADIVDNLATNSSTVPLSARQGKVLNDNITQLGQRVDGLQEGVLALQYSLINGFISTSGAVGASSDYKHTSDIFLRAGDTIVSTTAGNGFCAIAKSNGGSYTPIVNVTNGQSSVLAKYKYTADEDCYVSLTFKTAVTGYGAIKKWPLAGVVEELYNNSREIALEKTAISQQLSIDITSLTLGKDYLLLIAPINAISSLRCQIRATDNSLLLDLNPNGVGISDNWETRFTMTSGYAKLIVDAYGGNISAKVSILGDVVSALKSVNVLDSKINTEVGVGGGLLESGSIDSTTGAETNYPTVVRTGFLSYASRIEVNPGYRIIAMRRYDKDTLSYIDSVNYTAYGIVRTELYIGREMFDRYVCRILIQREDGASISPNENIIKSFQTGTQSWANMVAFPMFMPELDNASGRTLGLLQTYKCPQESGYGVANMNPYRGLIWSDNYCWRFVSDNTLVTASKAYMCIGEDGTIFGGKNIDEVYGIASITKVIAAIVMCDNITNWDETVVVANTHEVQVDHFVSEGDVASFATLLACMMVTSDNNAANAIMVPVGYKINPLAENDEAARSSFCDAMAAVAERIGMTNTSHFTSAVLGVNSTARDLCKMLKFISDNDDYMPIRSVWGLLTYEVNVLREGHAHSYTIDSTIPASARLIVPEFVGGKTGSYSIPYTYLPWAFVWHNSVENKDYYVAMLEASYPQGRIYDGRHIIDETYGLIEQGLTNQIKETTN